MPRKRRTAKARVVPKRLGDFEIRDILSMLAGWEPPDPAWPEHQYRESPWTTYEEFVSDYLAVRDQVLARHGDRAGRGPIFGEQVLAFRDRYGAAELATVKRSYEIKYAEDED